MSTLNDWAQHVMWAEKNLKDLEDKLLHKKFEGAEKHVSAINSSLAKVIEWIEANK
jgi:hypothetical protein